jgi:hypothetical protein
MIAVAPRSRTCRWLPLAVLSFLLAGCGKSEEELVPVTGTVLVDGKPAAGAAVVLHPADGTGNGTHPLGQVDAAGNFQLTTVRSGDGAAPGQYKVTLTQYVSGPVKRGVEGEDAPAKNLIPDKYARAETTPLTATIRPGGNDPLHIEISTRR